MNDFLKPLDEMTKEEWRKCAVFHEKNSFQKSKKIEKLQEKINQAIHFAYKIKIDYKDNAHLMFMVDEILKEIVEANE